MFVTGADVPFLTPAQELERKSCNWPAGEQDPSLRVEETAQRVHLVKVFFCFDDFFFFFFLR